QELLGFPDKQIGGRSDHRPEIRLDLLSPLVPFVWLLEPTKVAGSAADKLVVDPGGTDMIGCGLYGTAMYLGPSPSFSAIHPVNDPLFAISHHLLFLFHLLSSHLAKC